MTSKNTTKLLQNLRNLMKTCANPEINAYIVPSCDAHMSEYISEWDTRRSYISGFTGSAGTVIVTQDQACLWTDGRYFLQAISQLDSNWKLMKEGIQETPSQGKWLCKVLPTNSRVGVDPYLMSHAARQTLIDDLSQSSITLVPIHQNLIDLIWENKISRKLSPPFVQPIQYTGKSLEEKIISLREKMAEKNAFAVVVSMLDEIAWLLNLRGNDIQFNPLFFAYVVVLKEFVILFTDNELSNEVKEHLFSNSSVRIVHKDYSSLKEELEKIIELTPTKIWVTSKTNCAIFDMIPTSKRFVEHSAIEIMKSMKTQVELEGMINCHIRDAVALIRFFSWLELEIKKHEISEIDAANYAEKMRKENENYVSLSFDTISSVGSNASIIHYKPTPETNKIINANEIFLFDSGAQYLDGTTDVTRTIHLGTPTAYEKECFTHVLKGHIALDSMVFPDGTTKGIFLDSFARYHLWSLGLDYPHGTGHGVGSFLNVHEGPFNIGFRIRPEDIPLKAGMVLSNEPGYYEDGKFGVRIENLVYTVEKKTKYNYKSLGYLTFEDLTLVPIQTKLIDISYLTQREIEWVNSYHKKCLDVVGPELKKKGYSEAYDWLVKETLEI